MAKKYYIDFSGYVLVEANSPEEAEEKFWANLPKAEGDFADDVWDVDGIEEYEQGVY